MLSMACPCEDLLRKLQRALHSLSVCVDVWESILPECADSVSGVANLCEQYINCRDAHVASVSKHLPDIHNRLLHKIALEVDHKLTVLREKVDSVKETQCQFSKLQEECMQAYKNKKCELHKELANGSKPKWMSNSEMLEIQTDAESLLFDLYHCKLHWLRQVSVGIACDDGDNLVNVWCSYDGEIMDNLRGISLESGLCH